jgi:hypothetical protein
MKLYPFYQGRTEVEPDCVMRGFDDCANSHTCSVRSIELAFLEQDIGPVSCDVMSSIKEALHPNGILNPG